MRKTTFIQGEYYHIYNRGVDKRIIFEKPEDLQRFFMGMNEFNNQETVGGIRISSFKNQEKAPKKLVTFVAYCINQNHFHLILEPVVDNGIQRFMHRLSTGYTKYFNDRYDRSGSLFQGRYKSIHIETNEYLLHLSAYVNLNNFVHKNTNSEWFSKLHFSSLLEYSNNTTKNQLCNTSIILNQYKTKLEYIQYAQSVLPDIIKRKEYEKSLKKALIE